VTIHHQGRERLLLGEHEAERAAHLAELGRTERALPVDRRVARCGQHHVLVAQRHVEDTGQEQHHLPARLRAPGLEEAQMARGDLRLGGQRELAHPPGASPVPQHVPEPRRHGPGDPLRQRPRRHTPLGHAPLGHVAHLHRGL